MTTFGELFIKYRLRAEFATLSAFADTFAEKGYVYDISILSQWQRGKRIPTKRATLVAMISVFMERRGIISLEQANAFMESAGHGYLTKNEQECVLKKNILPKPKNRFLFD